MIPPVVVTGIGVVAPNGATREQFWQNCLAQAASVSPVPSHWQQYAPLTSTLWAPLPEFGSDNAFVNRIEAMQLDKATILGLRASHEALRHAGFTLAQNDEKKNTWTLGGVNPLRGGVFIGTGMGGISSFASAQGNHLLTALKSKLTSAVAGQHDVAAMLRMPPRFNPFIVSMVMPNACAAALGIKLAIKGPNRTCCQACAAGAYAIGNALKAIQSGSIDWAIAGGVEYLGDEYGGIMRGFDVARALVRDCSEPSGANRPFDKKRSGFLFAEGGAGILVLESQGHARSRGATPVARLSAFAESFDAHSMMAIEQSGSAIESMVHEALAGAGIGPAQVDYINAHATGTELNDEIEAQLIDRIFGKKPIVNATKSLIGHTVGAAGAIEAAVTVLSIRDQATHGCHNLEEPVRDLNFVKERFSGPIHTALSQSFAFGGHNAALVVQSP